MKLQTPMAQLSSLFILLFFLASCSPQTTEPGIDTPVSPVAPSQPMIEKEGRLPVQYQKPSYMVNMDGKDSLDAEADDVAIKVGASIRSTQGPQPLWDILKRLASLKKMNVSWASDVDQHVLVDVDINANDDFYDAIENLLRQVDYYHEMEGSTIVVKYKETRQFHIAMPFTKHLYETGTGGNVLGSNDASSNIEGTIRLDSKGNEFDIWKNIQDNMEAILDIWSTSAVTEEPAPVADEAAAAGAESTPSVTRQVSASGNRYTIDKPVGLITVHAPRPLLDKLEVYFNSLKKELYKQISIEAKIIEVLLTDNSSIGINWNKVLSAFQIDGTVQFGTNEQVYPWIPIVDGGSKFVSKVSIDPANFTLFLNALKEEGQTKILSNPKISVLNGQPALITVGRNVTYIDSVESDVNNETRVVTYTVETERVLSGIGLSLTANILDDDEIILNLVPVTSELEEPIEYKQFGLGEVGLPIINVREMSTTVRVKDGEMLVIGGLISNTNQKEGNFAPVVGKIPLIRYLFGYEEKIAEKRELIILLRPRII
ncbi:MAG: pilus (MSHA type) biogenesis protein MshL [Proteobacteria bacterium]|nr:pilus (MSHA type) biogenesis protein MshL [Pseudomonadota bacterium]MBU1057553.1 pilus (MSHA type) biogenesis protein MshL [Pseudomonadota bacterium]